MKIAVATDGPSLEDSVSTRFARAPYFLIVDSSSLQYEAIPNAQASDVAGGLGLKAAWLVVNRRASMVIAGRVGGNAQRILDERGVKIVSGLSGVSAREAVSRQRGGTEV